MIVDVMVDDVLVLDYKKYINTIYDWVDDCIEAMVFFWKFSSYNRAPDPCDYISTSDSKPEEPAQYQRQTGGLPAPNRNPPRSGNLL